MLSCVVYGVPNPLRGGPFDTQGGLCKFSKTIIWFSLIKSKLSGFHVVRKKIIWTNFVAWSFLVVKKICWLRLVPYSNFTKTNMDLDSVTQNTSDNTCICWTTPVSVHGSVGVSWLGRGLYKRGPTMRWAFDCWQLTTIDLHCWIYWCIFCLVDCDLQCLLWRGLRSCCCALRRRSTGTCNMDTPGVGSPLQTYRDNTHRMRVSNDLEGSDNMGSLGVVDLDLSLSPDVFGLRAFDDKLPLTRMLPGSNPCELRLLLPDSKMGTDGFHVAFQPCDASWCHGSASAMAVFKSMHRRAKEVEHLRRFDQGGLSATAHKDIARSAASISSRPWMYISWDPIWNWVNCGAARWSGAPCGKDPWMTVWDISMRSMGGQHSLS